MHERSRFNQIISGEILSDKDYANYLQLVENLYLEPTVEQSLHSYRLESLAQEPIYSETEGCYRIDMKNSMMYLNRVLDMVVRDLAPNYLISSAITEEELAMINERIVAEFEQITDIKPGDLIENTGNVVALMRYPMRSGGDEYPAFLNENERIRGRFLQPVVRISKLVNNRIDGSGDGVLFVGMIVEDPSILDSNCIQKQYLPNQQVILACTSDSVNYVKVHFQERELIEAEEV